MVDRLAVNLRKFHQLHHVYTALAALTLGHKVRGPTHHFRNFVLRQASLLASRDETFQERLVGILELGGSCFP